MRKLASIVEENHTAMALLIDDLKGARHKVKEQYTTLQDIDRQVAILEQEELDLLTQSANLQNQVVALRRRAVPYLQKP